MPTRQFAILPVLCRGILLLSAWVNRLFCGLLVGFSAAMIAVVVLQVICRYLFNNSLFWSEELARMLLVQITFLGAAVAFRKRAHIAVDILAARLGPRSRRLLHIVSLLACAALFAAMLVYGWSFGRILVLQQAASLPVNLAVPFAVIPVSGGVLLLHCLAMFIEQWGLAGPDLDNSGGADTSADTGAQNAGGGS